MAETLTGAAYGIEIPPGDVEALRSSAGRLDELASHIGEELRRATTERTGLSGTWGGLAAANYQKTATDLELGLRTLEAHIHEASGAIHTYASALESSKAGAKEAIRIASDAESIWQELQRWADAEAAALQSAATATLGAGAAGVSALLSDIERQLQQGYDTYRSELTRAVHRAEQEMQAAKHSAHLLAGRLHQGVVKMPGTLWGLGVAPLLTDLPKVGGPIAEMMKADTYFRLGHDVVQHHYQKAYARATDTVAGKLMADKTPVTFLAGVDLIIAKHVEEAYRAINWRYTFHHLNQLNLLAPGALQAVKKAEVRGFVSLGTDLFKSTIGAILSL
ncbi:MAG: WXG100 family type VII secretion target [Acidimicrobiales bacterium]